MRVYEDNQEQTTCLQYFIPQFMVRGQRRVLSDKKIKRQKKINLSLVEHNDIGDPKKIEQKSSLSDRIKVLNKNSKPYHNSRSRNRLTISSSVYKNTPNNKKVHEPQFVNEQSTKINSYTTMTRTERPSLKQANKQTNDKFETTTNYNRKLTEIRNSIMQPKLNKDLSRKINFNSQQIDEKQMDFIDCNRQQKTYTQRLTNKKPPNFFKQIYETKTKERPYLALTTHKDPSSKFNCINPYQTQNIINKYRQNYPQHLNLKSGITKQIYEPYKQSDMSYKTNKIEQIHECKQSQSTNKASVYFGNQNILPLLDQLRQSLDKNSKKKNKQQQSNSNKQAEFLEDIVKSEEQCMIKKQECIQRDSGFHVGFSSLTPNQKQDRQIYEIKSLRKQPLKKLIDGANTIVSKYDDDSGQKSSSDAFSNVIFRLNGDGKHIVDNNGSNKNQQQISHFDQQLNNEEPFKKRFGYSYKNGDQTNQKVMNSLSNQRQSYNIKKKILFSEQKPSYQNFDTDYDQIQLNQLMLMNKNSSKTIIDQLPKDISQQSQTDWCQRIEQIYITNKNRQNQNDFMKIQGFSSQDELSVVIDKNTIQSDYFLANRTYQFGQRFKKINYLGVGRFSSVYSYYDIQTHYVFAVKEIFKFLIVNQQLQQQLMKQIFIQNNVCHPNIVQLYRCYQDAKKYYLFIQYVSTTNLYQQIQKKGNIQEKLCISYIKDIALGLKYLHSTNIAHRDIKPENILLTQGVCKIADFGCAGILANNQYFSDTVGTPIYISPQIDQLKPYTLKTDCWSLGVLAYEIRVGKIDFEEKTSQIEIFKFPDNNSTSQSYKQMVSLLLAKEENQRISINELLQLPIFQY